LASALEEAVFATAGLVFIVGFVPRVGRGARASSPLGDVEWDHASRHNCRPCKSLRKCRALDAGGWETLYGHVDCYEVWGLLSERQKAALRYVDALICRQHVSRLTCLMVYGRTSRRLKRSS
jgi:hypothetical protein